MTHSNLPPKVPPGSWSELAYESLRGNQPRANEILDAEFPTCRSNFFVSRDAHVHEVVRSDTVTADDEISFLDYSPPPLWEPPFSILLATLSSKKKNELMVHPGEEVVIPVEGEIEYDFWEYKDPNGLPAVVTKGPCSPGEIWRINPSLPHHTRARSGSAKAWMLFRDLRETSVSNRRPKHNLPNRKEESSHLRRWSIQHLEENPHRFLLSASRLLEKTRLFRTKSGHQLQELARECDIDRGFLSKFEDGKISIGRANVERIASYLGFDPSEGVLGAWNLVSAKVDFSIPAIGNVATMKLKPPVGNSLLHFRSLYLKAENPFVITPPTLPVDGEMKSWIILKGITEFVSPNNEDKIREVLKAGDVFHLRYPRAIELKAYADSEIVEVTHSPVQY